MNPTSPSHLSANSPKNLQNPVNKGGQDKSGQQSFPDVLQSYGADRNSAASNSGKAAREDVAGGGKPLPSKQTGKESAEEVGNGENHPVEGQAAAHKDDLKSEVADNRRASESALFENDNAFALIDLAINKTSGYGERRDSTGAALRPQGVPGVPSLQTQGSDAPDSALLLPADMSSLNRQASGIDDVLSRMATLVKTGPVAEPVTQAVAQTTGPVSQMTDSASQLLSMIQKLDTNPLSPSQSTSPSYPMQAQVNTPAWLPEMQGRVQWMLNNNQDEAKILLNPPELGKLEIKISTDGDQTKVHFLVQNQAAKDALESGLPRLRAMLEGGGLSLAQGDVTQQQGGHSSGHSDRGVQVSMADDGENPDMRSIDEPLEYLENLKVGLVDHYV